MSGVVGKKDAALAYMTTGVALLNKGGHQEILPPRGLGSGLGTGTYPAVAANPIL